MAIEQVQSFHAHDPLFGILKVEGYTKGSFGTGLNAHIRRHPSEMDANPAFERIALKGKFRRNIDIGSMKLFEFFFPIRRFKIQEKSTKGGQIVKILARKKLGTFHGDFGTGSASGLWAHPAGSPSAKTTSIFFKDHDGPGDFTLLKV